LTITIIDFVSSTFYAKQDPSYTSLLTGWNEVYSFTVSHEFHEKDMRGRERNSASPSVLLFYNISNIFNPTQLNPF